MNKAELIVEVGSKKAVEDVLNALAKAIVAGERVAVPELGIFELKNKPARTGRNPATGAPVAVAAKATVRFKPGKGLLDKING